VTDPTFLDPTDRLERASRAYEAAFGRIAPPPSFVDSAELAEALERAVAAGDPKLARRDRYSWLPPDGVA
jgi:hypothetical protein